MATAPSAWLNRLTPDDPRVTAGLVREHQEDRCEAGYARVVAPPCPVCHQPVRDEDWQRHRFEDHGVDDGVQPYGKPDARECVVVGRTQDELVRNFVTWRRKHPGLHLALAGEGSHPVLWRRFRILDARGRSVR